MTPLEHFKKLCTIPHCSGDAGAMLTYLSQAAQRYGYTTHTDKEGNLLCTHPDAKLTLQAHYDMVCIGKAPEIVLYEEAGWLHAKESTLGADNGMGMAIMLALMEEGEAVDCLFTSDEEIGLVGARALQLPLKIESLLNLDSEAFGEIMIGCAGGVDINVTLPLQRTMRELYCYEVSAEGFPGGHSGVDIDKNIPNAIKELAARLYALNGAVVAFDGGERRNAIAKRATATVGFSEPVEAADMRLISQGACAVMDAPVVTMLHAFAHGVRAFDTKLGIVRTSVNLAEVKSMETSMHITLSVRAMSTEELRRCESETRAYFEAFGADVQSEGFYAPWEPQENDFVQRVKAVYESVSGEPVSVGAIHAGLECGIIKERYPQMQMASIGPTIVRPHSTGECVELASVERIYTVVKRLVSAL